MGVARSAPRFLGIAGFVRVIQNVLLVLTPIGLWVRTRIDVFVMRRTNILARGVDVWGVWMLSGLA